MIEQIFQEVVEAMAEVRQELESDLENLEKEIGETLRYKTTQNEEEGKYND